MGRENQRWWHRFLLVIFSIPVIVVFVTGLWLSIFQAYRQNATYYSWHPGGIPNSHFSERTICRAESEYSLSGCGGIYSPDNLWADLQLQGADKIPPAHGFAKDFGYLWKQEGDAPPSPAELVKRYMAEHEPLYAWSGYENHPEKLLAALVATVIATLATIIFMAILNGIIMYIAHGSWKGP